MATVRRSTRPAPAEARCPRLTGRAGHGNERTRAAVSGVARLTRQTLHRSAAEDVPAMTQLQRREALLTAAAIGSLPLLKLWPEALAAEPGLRFRSRRAVQLRVAHRAREGAGGPTLRTAAATGAGRGASDRLRRARQAALPARVRAVRRRPGRLSGHLPVSRRLLPQDGADARGRGRPGARDHLLARLLHRRRRTARRASCRPTPTPSRASGSRRAGCRATGRKREPWATFLGASYFRAVGELGQVGMSARGLALNVGQQHARGIPGLRRPLDRAGGQRERPGRGPLAARRPEHLRRVPLHDLPRPPRGHGDREPSVPAPGHRAAGHRAADLDVLVRRVRPREDRRLAARGARFGRARDLERRRRAHLAPAQQPDPDLPHQLSRPDARRASA